MTLYSLECADVSLRIYSLSLSFTYKCFTGKFEGKSKFDYS